MTDEERKEAKRLAKEYVARISGDPDPLDETASMTRDFTAGYAAACEAKREEYGRDIGSEAFDETVAELEAERARSARLIESLRSVAAQIDLSEWQNSYGSTSIAFYAASKLIEQAIAEYEASRD